MNDTAPLKTTYDALIVIDVQTCFTDAGAAFDIAQQGTAIAAFYDCVKQTVIPNLQRLLAGFRDQGAPVYYTEMGSLRADGADLPVALRNANNLSIATSGTAVIPHLDEPQSRTDSRIAPRDNEVVFRKTTTGTLASTPLASNLRALNCKSIVVGGIVTDCCVAQTARELADQDFVVTIVEDACASYDMSHHRATLEVFSNYYGEFVGTSQVIAAIRD